MVVIHILPQRLRHGPVPLIGVHHRGEDVLLAAHDFDGCPVGLLEEPPGEFIPAVVVEVGGVHIEDQLPEGVRVHFQSPG